MAEFTDQTGGLAPLPEDGTDIPIVTFGLGVGAVMERIDFHYDNFVQYLLRHGYIGDEIKEVRMHVDTLTTAEAQLYEALGQTLLGHHDAETGTQYIYVMDGLDPAAAPLDHVLQHETSHDRDHRDGVANPAADERNRRLDRAWFLQGAGAGASTVAVATEALSLALGDTTMSQVAVGLAILAFISLAASGHEVETAKRIYLDDPTEIRARQFQDETPQGSYFTFVPRAPK